ncbi:CooT family nickel-binding protein [Clostridium sp. WLY-B-L2]|jgi:predicted RNA-binding protein|uniref:CooT family nickel-binding protein n=1 Tax=Clostridium aromativorans TaxID=2836848 RepID=A0ABS8N6I1_9CLOT|nr:MULTISPECIES: CooT family nickel-binding protein [Clostridium]KAA8672249.1 CooT family nickel-binding protein [Clostridium sp. HV4-5-A1G]MCC9294779.1 CooT family nickel-binding protein [Clostridium aromativorans]CAB1262228.1 RNA-binding protein [Clostridiaceae bacterium BL-3]
MCESTAYLVTPEGESKVMDYVVNIIPKENGKLFLTDILGEEKIIEGMLKEVDLLKNKIVIEKVV